MGTQETSATTGTNFIAAVRRDYNDTTTTYFDSTSDMLVYLNDGTKDIAVKTHCMQGTKAISLVADTLEYSIADTENFIEVMGVLYYNGTKSYGLKPGNPSMVGLNIEEGDTDDVLYWYEFGGKVGAYPTLSAVTTQTITVYIAKWPDAIAAGSNVPTPAIYDPALKLYMLARMALKDKNTEMYSNLMAEYNNILVGYRKDMNE